MAQNDYKYGNFMIRNFDAGEYKGAGQNWDIIQTNDNFIVVANNAHTLLYTGEKEWKKVKLNNGESVRSFAKNDNGDIFVGGANEFGRIYFDEKGEFKYEKLSGQFDSLNIGIIWNTLSIFDDFQFVSEKGIYVLNDQGNITLTQSLKGQRIKKGYSFDNTAFCYINTDSTKFCSVFDGNSFTKVKNSDFFEPITFFSTNNISYVIGKSGEIREVIKKDGVYIFENIDNRLKIPSELYVSTAAVNKKLIAIGTSNGIFLFNKKGEFIRSIQENEGLLNLQIRKLMFDQNNNLWSCNDNGISLIDLSNPITTFDKRNGVKFTTEDIYFSNDKTLLATRTDLFYEKIVNGRKQFVNSEVFNMEVFQIKSFTFPDGTVKTLVIANNGIYEYINDEKIEIAQLWAWDLFQSKSNPNRIWIGLDGGGVGSLIYKNGNISVEQESLKNTTGEVRKIIEFENEIYYAVKNKGIHILDTTKTQDKNVLPGIVEFEIEGKKIDYNQFTLEVFKNQLYVGTDNGLYKIVNHKLVPYSDFFNKARLKVHRIFNQNNTKLWLVLIRDNDTQNESYEIGYIDFTDESKNYISHPFISASNEVIQAVNQDKNGQIWFAGLKEIYIYNSETPKTFADSIETFITHVSTTDTTTKILTHFVKYAKDKSAEINYNSNTVSISFTSTSYVGNVNNTFSYYLEGLEKDWSDWSSKTDATFPRLSEGIYTFHVKAKNYYGIESPEATYTFTILPPWYRTWLAYFVYFILVIIIIYIIIKLSIRRVKEQNEKLEKIVEERTAKVELQKEEIEEKNRDIVDSIKYAKRIQNTILPTDDFMDSLLENYFVIYRPKDIVSGDFYWADSLDGKAYFSAIDCTGHGVPGAFVSIVGFNGLKRTVNEFKHRQPGLILDKLTDIVVETFTATESHLKDGMDMTLCSLDYKTLKLEFAGANNPLILIRDGEIIETKGNKQPIGDFEHRIPFTNHEIQLQKGDCLYLFTDGYADQFGGPKGKKFKLKTLKNLLLEISSLPIKEQKKQLEIAFDEWKGHIEQLDDVCLIGVKI